MNAEERNSPVNRAPIAFFLLAVLAAPTAHAAGNPPTNSGANDPPSTLDITYDLFAGPFALGKVGVHQVFQGAGYKANSTLKTSGIINLFWRSVIDANATGTLQNGHLQPAFYDSHSVNHADKKRQVSLSYSANSPPVLFAKPPYSTKKYPVSDEQKKDTLDPVSAVAFMTAGVSANSKVPCGSVAPVFDGARRYDVAVDYMKTDNIHTDNGLYNGPAFVCQIHYRQIAGYKQKVLSDNAKFPDIFAWVASMPSRSNPSRRYLVPVRIWATTMFGTISATASHVKIDGVQLKGKTS
jgi:Protein of unknown function (DUF3108)